MTETVPETVAATSPKAPKKKATTPKAKGVSKKTPATHPPTAQMVNAAIKSLKERGGSSLQAIKKYIAGTYKVDAEKLAPFIKKYLKTAVDGGKLIRTKGKGASGSFKLATNESKAEKKPKKAKVAIAKKPKSSPPPKVKKPKAEKSEKSTSAATPKKPKATKPKSDKPKPKTSPKKKSPSKVKKATKAPAAKTGKSPKPKKAAPKKTAVKKPVAKK